MSNELKVLKQLSDLLKSGNLPKDLLRKKDLERDDLHDVVLSFCDDNGILEVGFIYDNGYDASRVSYESFDNVCKYLDTNEPKLSDTPVDEVNKNKLQLNN